MSADLTHSIGQSVARPVRACVQRRFQSSSAAAGLYFPSEVDEWVTSGQGGRNDDMDE